MTSSTAPSIDTGDGTALWRRALCALLTHLRAQRYEFVTPTPATHRRVIGRPEMSQANDLRGAFGWSVPFSPDLLPADLVKLLCEAGVVERVAPGLQARVRVSSLDEGLFIHSAFPPSDEDAVFFGPDTYRFARFLRSVADNRQIGTAIDVGVGSGAGAAVLARHYRPLRLVGTDVNPRALSLAGVNLTFAGVTAELLLSDGLAAAPSVADLIVANPPFIAGDGERTYRDGGDLHGARLSLNWTLEGATRLTPGGRMLLYTGSAIVGGHDPFREALVGALDARRFDLDYVELDPDIFSGQLATRVYRDVERIAAVGVIVTRAT